MSYIFDFTKIVKAHLSKKFFQSNNRREKSESKIMVNTVFDLALSINCISSYRSSVNVSVLTVVCSYIITVQLG